MHNTIRRLKKEKEQLSKKDVLKYLEKYTSKITAQNEGDAADYSRLQYTWNKDILAHSTAFMPESAAKMIGIGSFQGALEMSLSHFFDEVICVDHENYLPQWHPKNVLFRQADIDSNEWKLPEDTMFDVCFCIETIEHLLWSPLPLLKWMKTYSHIAVISTPDDDEWPIMNIRPWTRYQKFTSIPAASPGVKGNPEPMNHCKQYKQAEFIEMLDFVGFRLIEFFRVGEGKHQMCAIVQPRS